MLRSYRSHVATEQVYERGVELFTYPVAFELWNIYLSKFVKRYVRVTVVPGDAEVFVANCPVKGGEKLERARDLFEQALEKCPEKSCKPIFLMYAKLEEEYGLAKRAMKIYDRATQVVVDADKFEVILMRLTYVYKVASSLHSARCSLYILRRRRKTMDSLRLDQYMNAP